MINDGWGIYFPTAKRRLPTVTLTRCISTINSMEILEQYFLLKYWNNISFWNIGTIFPSGDIETFFGLMLKYCHNISFWGVLNEMPSLFSRYDGTWWGPSEMVKRGVPSEEQCNSMYVCTTLLQWLLSVNVWTIFPSAILTQYFRVNRLETIFPSDTIEYNISFWNIETILLPDIWRFVGFFFTMLKNRQCSVWCTCSTLQPSMKGVMSLQCWLSVPIYYYHYYVRYY